MTYEEFIETKKLLVPLSGFEPKPINPVLFEFQQAIVRWGLRKGKFAAFEDCGLGKSLQEWEFAKQCSAHSDMPSILFAPLSVGAQMINECARFGYSINPCRSRNDVRSGINVANYEILDKFSPEDFGTIVLDESSILKGGSLGKTANELVDFASTIPYRMAATATPSPNDLIELCFHAEFLGIMKESEIKALFFTQDGNSSNKFRLKRNAHQAFYKWLSSWAVALRKPSDLGYSDEGFILPELRIHEIVIDSSEQFANGMLFAIEAHGISEQRAARRNSLVDRVNATAGLVNDDDDQWLVWCGLNDEGDALEKEIDDCVQVSGKDSPDHKVNAMLGFQNGTIENVVSKPSMWGFGMNFQNSHKAIFCGLGNSFEEYYQALKRQHRFGQVHPVDAYVIVTPEDGRVVENIRRKWQQNDKLFDELVKHMAIHLDLGATNKDEMKYNAALDIAVPKWLNANQESYGQSETSWINLDSIYFQMDGSESLTINKPIGASAIIIPSWIQGVI